MAQGYYTVEEAAAKLGISVEELSEWRKEGKIRAFADSGSWKFRVQDVMEQVRIRELTSDPDIALLPDEPKPMGPPARQDSGSDSGVKLQARPSADAGSDSDVKLVDVQQGGSGGGSDVELFDAPIHAPTDSDIRLDMADSGINLGGSSASGKFLGGGAVDKTAEVPADRGRKAPPAPPSTGVHGGSTPSGGSEGDFHLSIDDSFSVEGQGPGEIDDSPLLAPDAPTGREMSLRLPEETGSSADFVLPDSDDDDSILLAGDISLDAGGSGINLSNPDDSGLSLSSEGNDTDFELSLDPGPAAAHGSDAESDFELALDEDDDFSLGEDESGSEVVALDDSEDLDLDDEIEGDEEDEFDEDVDEDEDEDYEEFDEEYDEDKDLAARQVVAAGAAAAAPAPWSVFVFIPVMLNTIVLVLVGVMVYEMVRNTWSYNTPHQMTGPLIEQVADLSKSIVGN